MNFSQFVERFPKRKRFSAIYGPEEYLVYLAKTMILGDLKVDPLDFKSFDLKSEFSSFCDALHEQPLVGDYQVVLGTSFDSVFDKLAKVDFKGSVPKTTYVVLTSSAEKLDTKNDFAQYFISRGWWVWAKELDFDQKVLVLKKLFGVTESLAEKMVDVFGSLARVVSESKKLRALGKMNLDGFNLYSDFVAASEEDLVDKIFLGDAEAALKVLVEILNRGDLSSRIIGMITYKVEQVIRVLDAQAQGMNSYQELGKVLGVPVPFVDRVVKRSRKASIHRVIKMFGVLEKYDKMLKSGCNEDRVLSALVVELSGGV